MIPQLDASTISPPAPFSLQKKLGETSYGDTIGQLNLPDGTTIEVTLGDFLDGFQSLPLEHAQLQIFTINSNGEESTQDFPLEQ